MLSKEKLQNKMEKKMCVTQLRELPATGVVEGPEQRGRDVGRGCASGWAGGEDMR